MPKIVTVNPATGEDLVVYTAMSEGQIDDVVGAASKAQRDWASRSFDDRAGVLHRAAEELRRRCNDIALTATREMGKPIVQSLGEVGKCADGLDYFAEHSASFLSNECCATSADRSWISYDPIGVVLAIMPWNFPLWQVFRFVGPALMAGNGALLKHSPNTTGCALLVQEILETAGMPVGLFSALLIAEDDVAATTERLIADNRIGAVTLTGSERAGRAVGAAAGREIKKTVLELGGSDPFVVLADADLPTVAAHAVKARFLNAGQSCISPKRFIVDRSVVRDFTDLVLVAVASLTVGDPEQPTTAVGPMARADLRDLVDGQVAQSLQLGAELLAGGSRMGESPGWFFQPTVLADVRPGMAAYDEEIFGPVVSIIAVDDQDEAVCVANDSRYGLGASVWSRDAAKAVDVGRRITSGTCFINAPVASDARLPFGGTKKSGYGRELASAGIREFVNIRSWWVDDHAR
jgi:succinate-semialdehyde dehydrogenase / glutarate-semialdehyde dehydrogenase